MRRAARTAGSIGGAPPRPARWRATPRQYRRIAATERSAPARSCAVSGRRRIRGRLRRSIVTAAGQAGDQERRQRAAFRVPRAAVSPTAEHGRQPEKCTRQPRAARMELMWGRGFSARKRDGAWLSPRSAALPCCGRRARPRATPVFLSPVNISDAGQDGFEGVVAVDSTGISPLRLDPQRRHQPAHPVPLARREPAPSARSRPSPTPDRTPPTRTSRSTRATTSC